MYQPRPDEDVTNRLAPARAKLAGVRKHRVPPLRDEKILAAWNGLAISALAVAGRVLGEERYLDAAVRDGRRIIAQRIKTHINHRNAGQRCDAHGWTGVVREHEERRAGNQCREQDG